CAATTVPTYLAAEYLDLW
nr:immunoglobulin heavy chain junction region [Macaca mulatta]MOX05188.1 immunoglobulin heavy chain junction region [Macaca mulatta]MOX05678.1 immunoglobulin heavy chain junction region [Macaca mulatta]MOX06160.1 immunoglobulin heavy chain junction region [Macaca mulatta]MOX06660.1 immunoglobulin heavy chain junction region [Macaca mulatta]